MKTKVAVIIPRLVRGGAENMVSRLVSNIDLNKFEIIVICIFGDYQNDRLEKAVIDAGVKIIYLNKGLGFSIKAIKNLWRELDKIKPNVINTHLSACLYAFPWALSKNIRMLHTIHNTPSIESTGLRRYIMKLLYRYNKATPIAISDIIKKETVELYNLNYERVELVYNPVELDKFKLAKPSNMNNSLITITNAGRLELQKNQEMLIKAFYIVLQDYPNLRLNIIGNGPLYEKLLATAKNLGIDSKVNFTGLIDNIEDYLEETDIFVLPSLYEGLPLTILEAMAAGLPIIASKVGGVPDIVTDNGILIRSDNEEDLVIAMKKLIDNKELRLQKGQLSRQYVQKYDIQIIKEQYENLYIKYAKI